MRHDKIMSRRRPMKIISCPEDQRINNCRNQCGITEPAALPIPTTSDSCLCADPNALEGGQLVRPCHSVPPSQRPEVFRKNADSTLILIATPAIRVCSRCACINTQTHRRCHLARAHVDHLLRTTIGPIEKLSPPAGAIGVLNGVGPVLFLLARGERGYSGGRVRRTKRDVGRGRMIRTKAFGRMLAEGLRRILLVRLRRALKINRKRSSFQ